MLWKYRKVENVTRQNIVNGKSGEEGGGEEGRN